MSTMPSRSVVALLRELDAAGYETVLVSAAEAPGRIERRCAGAPGEPAMPDRTTILRRANVGYDFGSWAAVLSACPGVASADRVLLTNDSLYGPFGPLIGLLSDFENDSASVWGAVAAAYPSMHLQSHFLGFKGGILAGPELQRFWSGVRAESGKNKVIRYGELGLSELLSESGVALHAAIATPAGYDRNPAVHAPIALMRMGFPFLKRAVVDDLRSEAQWMTFRKEVEEIYGVDPEPWLERPAAFSAPPGRWSATASELRAVRDLGGTPAAVRHLVRKSARHWLGGPFRPEPTTQEPWPAAIPGDTGS